VEEGTINQRSRSCCAGDMNERLEEEHLVGARAIRETSANTEVKPRLARRRRT
jgi:hypothetical protein